jgi:hypothetical protein
MVPCVQVGKNDAWCVLFSWNRHQSKGSFRLLYIIFADMENLYLVVDQDAKVCQKDIVACSHQRLGFPTPTS